MISVVVRQLSSHGFPVRAVFSFPDCLVLYQMDVVSDELKTEAKVVEE